jgi:NarL family two-component system sensor histidine kinase LiaS
VDAQLAVAGELGLENAQVGELYRVIQEALNNALKHAAATTVQVRLTRRQTCLCAEIEDNGSGFEVALGLKSGGFGLESMKERCNQIGATLAIESHVGAGTRVTVEIPVKQAQV